MAENRYVIVSAPGKILVCGGYSVLKGGTALVFSTDARFYSSVDLIESNVMSHTKNVVEFVVNVSSLQLNKKWQYKILLTWENTDWLKTENFSGLHINFSQTKGLDGWESENNIYIYYAIVYAFTVLIIQWNTAKFGLFFSHKIQIIIKAHNSFYSHSKRLKFQGIVPNRNALSFLPEFIFLGSELVKTGLGSSAALINSLIASILSWGFKWASIDSEFQFNLLHNLSHLAHFQAQGKVGSGFDIASGIYGSQEYYMSSFLECRDIIDLFSHLWNEEISEFSGSKEWLDAIKNVISAKWVNPLSKKISLPPRLFLLLGDTGKDAHTPTFVKSVFSWAKKNNEISEELFNQLEINNGAVCQLLRQLNKYYGEDGECYDSFLEIISKNERTKWKSIIEEQYGENMFVINLYNCLNEIQLRYSHTRMLMRKMGKESNVPIEPDIITQVLDATENINGVLFCGIPGGGYDAIFAVVLSERSRNNVENFWLNWKISIYSVPIMEQEKGVLVEKSIFGP